MLIGQKGVKYGLQVRQAAKPAAAPDAAKKKPSVFGDEDSEDEAPNVEQQIARQAARKQDDKKVRRAFVYSPSAGPRPVSPSL
jgi:hypothetical protein